MYKTQKILAIIPARGGSKRIKRKNLITLAGKPLIEYTFISAKASRLIDSIIVSTDNGKIASYALQRKVNVIKRPKILAGDKVPMLPVLKHALKEFESNTKTFPDILIILQPTSPLRTPKDIDYTIKSLVDNSYDSAETICKAREHPAYMLRFKKGLLHQINKKDFNKRSQDLPKLYIQNGSVFAFRRDLLVKENKIQGRRHGGVVIPQERSIDIDDYHDLQIVEYIIETWNRKY